MENWIATLTFVQIKQEGVARFDYGDAALRFIAPLPMRFSARMGFVAMRQCIWPMVW